MVNDHLQEEKLKRQIGTKMALFPSNGGVFELPEDVDESANVRGVRMKHHRLDRTGPPKLYQDALYGDDLFSSAFEVRCFREVLLEVMASEEIRADGVTVIDVVADHKLEKVTFATKEDYAAYLKAYLRKVERHLDEEGRDDDLTIFRRASTAAKTRLLNHFSDFTFYSGRSKAMYGAVAATEYRSVEGTVRPVLTFFRHGVVALDS